MLRRAAFSSGSTRPAHDCFGSSVRNLYIHSKNQSLRQRRSRAASSWNEDTTIFELQQLLDDAVGREDYGLAAQMRDSLKQKQIDNKLAVEDANRKFYDAFNSGDPKVVVVMFAAGPPPEVMDQIWGQGEHVQCTHPGAACIGGREMVMESWRLILSSVRPRAFVVEAEDVSVYATEAYGVVTCMEVVDADESVGRVAATNIFEKQKGGWKIVHHHGSALPVRVRRKLKQ